MLKLRRLQVEKFRSLARKTDLVFSDGINVLLGQNGTGKTTLLALLSMIARSDFSSLAKEEFAIEYELSTDKDVLVVALRNERVPEDEVVSPRELGLREVFRPIADVFTGTDRRRLLEYDAQRRITVRSKTPLQADAPGMPGLLDRGALMFFLILAHDSSDDLGARLLPGNTAHRLDESLDLLRSVTVAHELTLLVERQKLVQDFWAPPLLPDSMVQKLAELRAHKRPDYAFTHRDLPWLNELKDLMSFSASDLRVDVNELREPHAIQLGNLVFRFWWEDGTFITHEQLSYGQKRLLAFYYYLACNPDIVIADELVNGLHHRWITAAIEALGRRQVFLTSQNPLLLDYIPINSAEAVRRSFVLCRSEPRGGRPGWTWDNMTEEDAQELFNAYGVGVEHVSEILQSRGLW